MASLPTTYALDIGSGSLKLITFKAHNGTIELVDAHLYTFPTPTTDLRDDQERLEVWKAALAVLLKDEDKQVRKPMIIALPGDSTIVRYITLPHIPQVKLRKIIRFEAEQQIPLPLNEVEWAYAVLPSPAKNDVYAVVTAVRKKLLEPLLTFLSAYNFTVESVEAGQLALYHFARAYEGIATVEHDARGAMFVDIGADTTQTLMLYKGMCWGRTLHVGVSRIAGVIAERLGVDVKEAERLRQQYTQTAQGALPVEVTDARGSMVRSAIDHVLGDLLKEISRTISYYLSIVRGAVFGNIVLTGGGAKSPEVAAAFEKTLGIKTTVAALSARLKIPVYLRDRLTQDRSVYTLALGLVFMRAGANAVSANLLSETIRLARENAEKKQLSRFCACMAALFAILLTMNLAFIALGAHQRVERLKHDNAAVLSFDRALREAEGRLTAASRQLDLLETMLYRQATVPTLFSMLATVLPDSVWLERFSYTYESSAMVLSGKTAGTLADINTVTSALKEQPLVSDVTFEVANIEESTPGRAPVRVFTIQTHLKKGEGA